MSTHLPKAVLDRAYVMSDDPAVHMYIDKIRASQEPPTCTQYCEWCGDCLECCAGDPCPLGGVH